jgi:hypothetical protein
MRSSTKVFPSGEYASLSLSRTADLKSYTFSPSPIFNNFNRYFMQPKLSVVHFPVKMISKLLAFVLIVALFQASWNPASAQMQYPVYSGDSAAYQAALAQYDQQKQSSIGARVGSLPNSRLTVGKGVKSGIVENGIFGVPRPKGSMSSSSSSSNMRTSAESCLIPTDATWSVLGGNDDGSTGQINLGFNFDLYGTTYTSCWINNNGNITFNNSFGGYTPSGFPLAGTPMVAAFWDDIDTRTCGTVRYKLFGTRLVVSYEVVGQYSQNCATRNTIQIVIGTTNDPLLGFGQNVKFFYGDMAWTKGASTVGINSGDGSNYVQVGRFGIAGSSAYDGGGGATDGLDYLDYQCFSFNVSSVGNQEPSMSGFPTGNTVTLGCGQTANYTIQSLPPEVNQTVTTTVNTNGMCGVTTTVTNGAVSTVNISVTGLPCNAGTNTITFTSTDNGSPALTTVSTLTVVVGFATPTISPAGLQSVCGSGGVLLTSSSGGSYQWFNNAGSIPGATGQTYNATTTGDYSVAVTNGTCTVNSIPTRVEINPNPVAAITASGPTTFCQGGSVTLTSSPGSSYLWSNGATSQSITVTTPGNYTVTVTGAGGCSATSETTIVGYTGGPDSDGDGMRDACDADDDNDGITDVAECNRSNFFWSNPPTVSGYTATGVINGVGYTYTSDQPVLTTNNVFNHGIFPVSYGVPNIKCIQNINASNNTLTFSTPITNPVLVFSSIGGGPISVPIEFSDPVDILWSTAVVQNSPTRITGTEGYAIIRLNGTYSSISFSYQAYENYVNFLFGADFQTCGDTDGDGTLDYLDHDSDGDGCSDAIEGSQNPLASQISGGRLTGGIDASGIPLLVNGGQGIGTSKTSNVNCHCQPGIDRTLPTISCPGPITLASCETVIPDYRGTATSDNCSVTVTQSPAPGTAIAPGTTVSVTLIATDAAGNQSAPCTFTVNRPNITPVANNDAAAVCAGSSVTVNVLNNDSHPQGSALTVNDFTVPSVGTLVKNPDNTFTYTAPAGYSGPVTFTYSNKASDATIGFSGNGHYYEWVPVYGITWTDAKAQAATRTYNGLRGYLVTVTSAAEMNFVASKLQGSGWMGASDLAYEGTWRWVTGPEGLQDGGQGLHFSNQFKGGGTCSASQAPALPGTYSNWAGGEPNDCGAYLNQYSPTDQNRLGEHYAHFYGGGIWNDYPNNAGGNIGGYIVEYGGLEGCIPQLTATATVTINVLVNPTATIAAVGGTNACPGSSVTLNSTVTPGTGTITTYQWVKNGVSIPGANGPSYAAATPGSYTLKVLNSNSCGGVSNAINVTIMDVTPPSINCPATVNVFTNSGCTATGVNLGTPTGSDNCGVVTFSNNAPAVFPLGTTMVTWTANDGNGNTTTCMQTVNVTDNVRPAITCPAAQDLNLNANCSATLPDYRSLAAVSDNCSPAGSITITQSPAAGTTVNTVGSMLVTLTATDAAGNTQSCTFTVNKKDVTPPSITCPFPITVNNNPNVCGATVNYPKPVTSDNCSPTGPNVVHVLNPGQQFFDHANNVYENQSSPGLPMTFNPTDGNKMAVFLQNGSSTHYLYQNINVPATGPVMLTYDMKYTNHYGSFSTSQFIAVQIRNATTNALLRTVFTTSTSSPVSTPMTSYSFDISEFAGQNVRLQIIDATINNFYFDVLLDNIKVTGNAVVNGSFENDYAGWTVFSSNSSYGTWGIGYGAGVTLTQTAGLPSGSVFPIGTTTNTFVAVDPSGNSSTCSFTVTVNDVQFPVLNGVPPNSTVQCNLVPQPANVTASDNCPLTAAVQFSEVRTDGNCPSNYTLTRTWSITDASNNTTTRTQVLTVRDLQPPVISTPFTSLNRTVECSDPAAIAAALALAPSATDNCGAVTIALVSDVTTPMCGGTYNRERRWQFTDECGNNSGIYVQMISVRDFTAPTFTRPADITIYKDANCQMDLSVANTGDVTDENDNCSSNLDATFSDVVVNGSCQGEKIITRTWTLRDNCNNAAAPQVQTITVRDNTVPTFTAPADVVLYKGAECTVDDSPAGAGDVTNESDNCSTGLNATYSDVVVNNCEGTYTITRTWSLVDNCGNAAADQVQIITVKDNTAPTFTRPADVVLYKDAACAVDASPSGGGGDVTNEADNCSTGLNATYSDVVVNNCEGTYTITRTWSLVDNCGNAAADQVQTITVKDNIAPTVTSVTATVFHCYDDNVAGNYSVPVITATDNCTAAVNYQYSITGPGNTVVRSGNTNNASGIFTPGTSVINWTVTDNCGNTTTAQTLVTINPEITGVMSNFTVLSQGAQANTLYLGYTPASSATISIAAAGGTAPYTYSWSTNGSPASFTVVPGNPAAITITALAAGTFTYTVVVTDSKGCTAVFTKTITVVDVRCGNKNDKVMVCHVPPGNPGNPQLICIAPSAVNAHLVKGSYLGACNGSFVVRGGAPKPVIKEQEAAILAYPNPNAGRFNLKLSDFKAGKVKIEITDGRGKQVMTREAMVSFNIEDITLDLGSLAAGIYNIKVTGEKEVKVTRVVIAR